MSKNLDDVIGIQYAQALYDWADQAVKTGDYTVRPFADLTPSDELAVGVRINLVGGDPSKTTKTVLAFIQNALALALKKEEKHHA